MLTKTIIFHGGIIIDRAKGKRRRMRRTGDYLTMTTGSQGTRLGIVWQCALCIFRSKPKTEAVLGQGSINVFTIYFPLYNTFPQLPKGSQIKYLTE